MNDNSNTTKANQISNNLLDKLKGLKRYGWVILLLLFLAIYGYMVISINNFASAKPTQSQVTADLKTTPLPVINQNVVNQLENMQNNHVSVKALFNQARQNPFQ
jgi:cell division protein FtsX